MDPDGVTGSSLRQVCEDRLSGRKGGSSYSQRKADPLTFGTKMAPYLSGADLSFSNSVTGSVKRAKCSNILQDITNRPNKLYYHITLQQARKACQRQIFKLIGPFVSYEDKNGCEYGSWAQCYETFYICDLRILVISQNVCSWQAFQAQSNKHSNLQRKLVIY